MTKLPTLLAASLGLAIAAPLTHAQTTVVAYDGSVGYVSGNVNLNRQATPSGTGIRRTTFSDSVALNPLSNYSGPIFYGGYEVVTNLDANPISGQRILSGSNNIQIPGAFVSGDSPWTETTVASVAGILVFNQSDWRNSTNASSSLASGNVNISSISANYTITGSNDNYQAQFDSRWVLKSGSSYYISESSTSVQDVAATSWAAFTPATSGSLNLDLTGLTYSVSGAIMEANSISSVGLYFEADTFGFDSADPAGRQWDFQLTSLGFEGTAAIPEPSTYAVLAGACMLLAATARRRNRARN